MQNTDTPRDWLPPLPCTPDSKFIRVLNIAKPEDPSDQEIVCSIETLNIAQDTRFTALSYVWGVSPSLTKTIHCNGITVPVGTNCWSALWHLRNGYYSDDPTVSGGSRDIMTIWVDSICINQQDLKEKESQLQLMADIYSLARQAFVWLGEGTAESGAAIEYMNKAGFQEALVEVGEHQYELPQSEFFYLRQGWKLFTYQITNLPSPLWKYGTEFLFMCFPKHRLCDSAALQDICCRPWASRIWTFQEILLSPRPLLCCGTKTLSWRSFIHGITYLTVVTEYPVLPAQYRWRKIVTLWAYVQDSCELQNNSGSQQLRFQNYLCDYELFVDHIIGACVVFKATIVCLVILTIFFCLVFSAGLWEDSELTNVSLSAEAWTAEFILGLSLFLTVASIIIVSLYIMVSTIISAGRLDDIERKNILGRSDIDVRDAIIYEIATRKATNPKDKSFGLRAILSKIGPQLDDPDYDKDIHRIYRELFVRLLDWSESLNLLLFCDSPTTSTLPSWMPNWAIDPDQSWINRRALICQGGLEGVFFRTPSHWSLTDNEELVVRGVHLGCISWICGKFHETSATDHVSDEHSHLHNISMIHGLIRRYKAGKWTPRTKLDRHRILLHWERSKDPKQDKQRLKEWGRMMRRTSIMPDASMSALAYLKSHPECFEFHIDMCNDLARKGRTLFLTEPSTLGIGNGPTTIQVADLVTLVAGVSKPLILESRDTRYRLKGFAEMEYERYFAMRVHLTQSVRMVMDMDASIGGWEDFGDEMQPRHKIVIY
ncbi:HET domain-containing protein [Fusarium falciforme]|uniref:HET domain-containing protein n=1 Tax=Fusarium falciforme TaxID=195108 RepID=UPI002301C080|nr:HET domain-containing protein [Fusarium falciforme]WAO94488.1 HET domain-containing protein [Fusarium falciforme]